MSLFNSGPSSRRRSTNKAAKRYAKANPDHVACVFCDEKEVLVKQSFTHFHLLHNKFPYEVWNDHKVAEHLMIAPIRHRSSFHEFTAAEKNEYLELLDTYEQEGYSTYTRAPSDKTRSIEHLHTHLIKLSDDVTSLLLYIRAPHTVLRHFTKR